MPSVIKPLSTEMTLTTANTVSSATLVRLLETGGVAASLITVKTGNTTLGTITLPKSGEMFIRKNPTDTLTSSAGTVLATAIGYFN